MQMMEPLHRKYGWASLLAEGAAGIFLSGWDYLSDNIQCTMLLISSSLMDLAVAGIGMLPHEPAPPLRTFFSSIACAPLSFLYLLAISLKEGPSDL